MSANNSIIGQVGLLLMLCWPLSCGGTTVEAPAAAPTSEAPAGQAPPQRRLVAIDVYGSKVVSEETILSQHEAAIRKAWLGPAAERRAAEEAIREEILAMDDIAFVELSAITYFEQEGPVVYITIDLVDQSDASRLRFRLPPGGNPPDLAGIIDAWKRYEARFFELLGEGAISPERKPCPAWHCLGDYEHPELTALIEPVRSGVEENKEALVAVLFEHEDPQRRANAAFALAHADDGAAVVGWMLRATNDPSPHVRNNAMRVLSDIAAHHPEIEMPAAPVIRALGFPTTTDRNKALAVVFGLLSRPGNDALASFLRSDSVALERLLALLELKQPNNHDFAYLILKAISGQDHGERDYQAWSKWRDSLDATKP